MTGFSTIRLLTPYDYSTDPQIIDDLYINPFLAAQQRQNDVYDWNRFRFDINDQDQYEPNRNEWDAYGTVIFADQ